MNCTTCGAPLGDNVKFCEQCGTPVPQAEPAQPVEAQPAADAAQQPAAAAAIPTGAASQQGQQQYANAGQQQAYQQPGQQQAYQQQTYQQYQQPYQPYARVYPVSETQRSLAMLIYLSGLIGLLVALLVRDRNDAFITHHLNNVVVITIGSIICSLLCIIVIGFIGLLFLLVVWVMGIVYAYNGEIKDLPLIGSIKIIK